MKCSSALEEEGSDVERWEHVRLFFTRVKFTINTRTNDIEYSFDMEVQRFDDENNAWANSC